MSRWVVTGCVLFGHTWRRGRSWLGLRQVRCADCGVRLPRRFWKRVLDDDGE
ncbi:hypothetical protein PBI_DEWDROP_36 [Microbacterium phage Dewdrop]|nr:hypothetical protein PBI_LEAF_36 [Microbacterium phage Leaf]QGZ17405.1 hypothetical protein PBI_DEWDROP_36 [Microbacterium phage Dewdrop]